MSPAVEFALLAALTARLTIVLTRDRVGRPWRRWMKRRGPDAEYLSTCPWCVGVWIGALVSILAWLAPDVALGLGLWALIALAAGFAGAWIKPPDDDRPDPE